MNHRVCKIASVVAVFCAVLVNSLGGAALGRPAQVAPVITWTNPATITYGTALSATQLNATANVAGVFVYTPAIGTVLPATGTMVNPGVAHTLSVTFTPADTVQYTTTTKTVTIVVSRTFETTVAGGGMNASVPLGDGGLATAAKLNNPSAVAVDEAGNLYIPDMRSHRIRKVTAATGVITTVAGTGSSGFSGDGGLATAAQLHTPTGVALDAVGNLYIADRGNHRIRKVTAATGVIATVAGTGIEGFSGDEGPATAAQLSNPRWIAADAVGNVFVSQVCRIRKVTAATGVISTVVGTGTCQSGTDGGPATGTPLIGVAGVALNGAGDLYLLEGGAPRVRRVAAATGVITTLYSGQAANFDESIGSLAVDDAGNLYFGMRHSVFRGDDTERIVGVPVSGGPVFSVSVEGQVAVDRTGSLYVSTHMTWYGLDTWEAAVKKFADYSAPTITVQPGSQTLPAGSTASFTVGASAYPPATYQWQESADGGSTWTDLANAAPYGGVGTTTLTITPTSGSLSGRRYRARATNVDTATSAAATLSVTVVTPVIIWANPTTVPYGTVLTATQLNATANVPGTFAYTPSAGTTMRAAQTLSVTFTPTDPASYTTASKSVTIDVLIGGTPFTDPSLFAGVTPIRVVHIAELRTRIDALRVQRGLSAYAWTDSLLVAGQTPFRAVHVRELRAALLDVYVAAGRTPPEYTGQISAGLTTMNAVHVMELRAAVVAIE